MFLTEKFVFIHLPKTGGTFVSQMVGQIYGQGLIQNLKNVQINPPDLSRPFFIMANFKHATRKAIPPAFIALPILGCVRNPYDRYVSQYRYGSWKVADQEYYPGIREHCNFPDLSFSNYVELANKHLWTIFNSKPMLEQSIGWQTASFIKAYCRQEIHEELKQGLVLTADILRSYTEPVRFLHTENLNEELYLILKDLGYRDAQVKFIRNASKVLPGESANELIVSQGKQFVSDNLSDPAINEKFYSPELRKFVRKRERLLFELFPEWDR